VVCPWHNWKFHRVTGVGEPGSEDDAVPSYKVKVKFGRMLMRRTPATPRKHKPHAPHPLARPVRHKPGPVARDGHLGHHARSGKSSQFHVRGFAGSRASARAQAAEVPDETDQIGGT